MIQTRQQRRKNAKQMEKIFKRQAGRQLDPERKPSGKINTYTCVIGHVLITRDLIVGVTPMITKCLTCGRDTHSAFYNVDQTLTPTHEWDRPPVDGWHKFSPQMIEHFKSGGLALTEI